MPKTTVESRIPMGSRIQPPASNKGLVKRSLQSGTAAASKLLPTKLKLPSLKPKFFETALSKNDSNKRIDKDETNIAKDDTFSLIKSQEKIPSIVNNSISSNIIDNKVIENEDKEIPADLTYSMIKEYGNEKILNDTFVKNENNCDRLTNFIGKKVFAVDTQNSIVSGTLKYVGLIQKENELWCGLECDSESEHYHDGCFNGIKYFNCLPRKGLMVPKTQVRTDISEMTFSDPKILELRNKLQSIKAKASPNNTKSNIVDITHQLLDNIEYGHSDSGPFSLLVGLENTPVTDCKLTRKTFAASSTPQNGNVNYIEMPRLSNIMFNQSSVVDNSKQNEDASLLELESAIEFQSIGFDPESSKSPSKTSSAKSNSSSPSKINNRGKQSNDMQVSNKNNTCHETKKFILGPIERRPNDNTRNEGSLKPPKVLQLIDKNRTGVVPDLISPTVSEKSLSHLSKQNSFDESLGILTPDQMNSTFLDMASPSMEDFNDILYDENKTTEKTVSSNSQSPITENVKSFTPDGLNSILNADEPCEEDNKTDLNRTVVSGYENYSELKTDHSENPETNMDQYEVLFSHSFIPNVTDLLNNDICSSNQNLDDELLPSVHSSILDPLSSHIDTTVNLDLPLDSRRYDNQNQAAVIRVDQTPSPEELPLDTVDIQTDISGMSASQFCTSIMQEQSQADSDTKTDTTKSVTSKVSNSFITSITSITSLDGYQGDGEMSRPVSRGADQSPTIGHRGVNNIQNHWQNIPINRRPDPMTDSDFFTESDADGHDEQVHRRDRKAQVIDGALYGGKLSDLPVMVSRNANHNDDSCMESSGVYTDVDIQRCSPVPINVIEDISPDGSSASTHSEASQKNNSKALYERFNRSFNDTIVSVNVVNHIELDNLEDISTEKESIHNVSKLNKHNSADDVNNQHDTNTQSPNDKYNKEEKNMALKKYKMPRRDVASKVKTMLSTTTKNTVTDENRPPPKTMKKGGRWDAVMNKISAGKVETKPKSYLKNVQSKVNSSRSAEKIKNMFEDGSVASGNNSPKSRTPPSKLKTRRVRRLPELTHLTSGSGRSSPHSSQSDGSFSGTVTPTTISLHKHTPPSRAAKKRDGQGRTVNNSAEAPPSCPAPISPPAPTQLRHSAPHTLTNGKVAPVVLKKPLPVGGAIGATNRGTPLPRKALPRRSTNSISPRTQPLKEQNRPSSPVNKLSPPCGGGCGAVPHVGARPATLITPQSQTRLSPPSPPPKSVEALAVLVQYLVFQLDALNAPRWKHQATESKSQLAEAALRLQKAFNDQKAEHDTVIECLNKISTLESELLLKESKYNAALEESAALSTEIKSLKVILEELKKDVADSRTKLTQAETICNNNNKEKLALIEDLRIARQEILNIKKPVPPPTTEGEMLRAEVQSLKCVLDLKMEELSSLRKQNEELEHAACKLPSVIQRNTTLLATVEDLQAQLLRKQEEEIDLLQQNKQLQESYSQALSQKTRLSMYNEELQYKLKHSTEVANLIGLRLEQTASPHRTALSSSFSVNDAENDKLNQTFPCENFVRGRSKISASFNEKYLHSSPFHERKNEWKSKSNGPNSPNKSADLSENKILEDMMVGSSPNSPKIKAVVEKNDSVSWVVDIEEPPEEIASRIVRRAGSFRLDISPPSIEKLKTQKQKQKGLSPASVSHALSQSASASCIPPQNNDSKHVSQLIHSTPFKNSNRKSHKISGNFKGNRRAASFSCDNYEAETFLQINSIDNDDVFTINNPMDKSSHNDSINIITNDDLTDLELLEDCKIPKESAGEALISGANSEDDSSLDERSQSSSDNESTSDCEKYIDGAGERLADPILQKIAETMDQSLSATPMEVSWSEDGNEEGECVISETDI